VVLATLLLTGCGSQAGKPKPQTHEGRGLTVELPAGWQTAKANLTPNLGDPRQVFAAGTYPPRYRPHDCAQVPVSALEDLGPSDAFVELEERGVDPSSDWAEHPPRPAHFGASLGGPSEASECAPGVHMAEHWFGFTDHGRHFYALVAFGSAASKATQDDAWGMLDSLKVNPAVLPDWGPNG
jgi:hypothetical protein